MDKIYLGNKLENFESSEPFLPISRVILKVDGQNGYIAGDESGRTIEKTMPWATQAMADSILESLKGQVYKPYSGSGALLDPAAELGDVLTVAGEYGVLAGMSRNLDRLGVADIAAPGASELDDEFPYMPRERREIERALGKAYSRITKTATEIRLEVANDLKNYATLTITDNKISTAVSSMEESVDGKLQSYSTIEQTSTAISQSVNGLLNGEQVEARITTALEGIELSISNGSTSSSFTLKAGETTLSSGTIKMTGLVTVTGLSGGTTTIDGACIKTGTIDADRLNLTDYVKVSSLTDGETIISGGNIQTGEISTDYIRVEGQIDIHNKASNITPSGTKGYFGYYQGWTINDNGDPIRTEGVGIRQGDRTGRVDCSSGGIWCGYGSTSGISAVSNGVTIKGTSVHFAPSVAGNNVLVDFYGCTVTNLDVPAVFG